MKKVILTVMLTIGMLASTIGLSVQSASATWTSTPNYEQIGNDFYCLQSGQLQHEVEVWIPSSEGDQNVTVKINLNGSQWSSDTFDLTAGQWVYIGGPDAYGYTSGYSTIVFSDGHALKANFPTTPPSPTCVTPHPVSPHSSYETIGNKYYCSSGQLQVSVAGWLPTYDGTMGATYKLVVDGSTVLTANGYTLGDDNWHYAGTNINGYTSGYSMITFDDGHVLKANFPATAPLSC